MQYIIPLLLAVTFLSAPAISSEKDDSTDKISEIEKKVIQWRHHIHQYPELGNSEFKTSEMVANHLRSLGFDEVQTQVAKTGVVGILVGGKPGPVVALRADMDALPVAEKTGLPFASKETAIWRGQETGLMHACGHDAHTAILMGVAELLASQRSEIPGVVKFIFQPAEEGRPPGEEGGAKLMVEEGVLQGDYAPKAIFGLHVGPLRAGTIGYRSGGALAASDGMHINIKGVQTHAAQPWAGVDPIVAAAQVVTNMQSIVSRQVNITEEPAVVSFGSINGGNRGNIIPEDVTLVGTIRTFSEDTRNTVHDSIAKIAKHVAESHGAEAEVKIRKGSGITYNDPALVERMLPTLNKVALEGDVLPMPRLTGAEDFPYYTRDIPGFYFYLGVAPDGQNFKTAAPNHSPYFTVNDKALKTGVSALSQLALDWLTIENSKTHQQ